MLNIYVGNLPFKVTEADLNQLFAPFGTVAKASIITDRETGRSRGFGFVEMPDHAQGQAAVEALNGKDFGGRYLTVNVARPRDQHAPPSTSSGPASPGNRPRPASAPSGAPGVPGAQQGSSGYKNRAVPAGGEDGQAT
jgi:RNA recognition motif-containing protein